MNPIFQRCACIARMDDEGIEWLAELLHQVQLDQFFVRIRDELQVGLLVNVLCSNSRRREGVVLVWGGRAEGGGQRAPVLKEKEKVAHSFIII